MAERIGGVLNFSIDGVPYAARGSFKVSPSHVKREGVAGQDGVHGYIETPLVPGIEGDLTTKGNLSLKQIEGITDSTIMCDLANGKSYVLTEAFTEAGFEIDTAEGKFGAKFGGVTCEEI